MATLATTVFTMQDSLSRKAPDGSKYLSISEMLHQTNEVLDEMMWAETNKDTSDVSLVRTGLPDVVFRKLNKGVPYTKSTTAKLEEQTAIMEAWQKIDINLPGAGNGVRATETPAFLEAMNQKMANQLFNGTNLSGEEFVGLGPRYSSLSAENGKNILDAAGNDTDLTSIYLVGWGQNTVTGLYPKNMGTTVGLMHRDLGEQTVTDEDGNPYRAFVDQYQWACGLKLPDWRYVVRIANIDKSALIANSSAADLIKLMNRAMYLIPSWGNIKAAFYCNRTVRAILSEQALAKSSNVFGVSDGLRQFETRFLGVPIKTCDAILSTETRVV